MSDLKKVWLYFENGTFLEARAFGGAKTKVGEAVFNTSLSGYQEIISDPSYAGQFIVFTMPEIGIVGTNDDDLESDNIHASGIIVRNLSLQSSNYRATNSLKEFMENYQGMGICDIDTRYITKMLRDEGAMMMIASTQCSDKKELKKMLESSPRIEDINYAHKVCTKSPYKHTLGEWNEKTQSYNKPDLKNKKRIVVIDFGVKRSILNSLCQRGLNVEVVPCDFDEEGLIKSYKDGEIEGVFLSNGPGEPLFLKEEIRKISRLIEEKIPMFGICLGHQLLSIAHGHPTYKLKFGQHGSNHPVFDTESKKVEITAQNHNYNVPESIKEIAKITHRNLFDGTIEGVDYENEPIFSVQHHPEASAGPHESRAIFDKFLEIL